MWHAVHFDNRERVSVDRKHIIGFACHVDQPESVSHAPPDIDDGQIGCGASWKPAEAIDQSRVGCPNGC